MLQIRDKKTNLITDDEIDFIKAIETFMKYGDSTLIQEVMSYFSEFCFNEESTIGSYKTVTNDFVNKIIKLVTNLTLVKMEKSYSSFKFFLNDWNRFTIEQKKYILSNLKNVFLNIEDTTSQMIIIEIIAQYIANQESLETLNNFKTHLDGQKSKYLIAYGYKLLIQYANNKNIKKLAWKELLSMKNDSLENVRREVAHAVEIINKNDFLEK